MSKYIVLDPKDDITAFELAHISIAVNTFRGIEECKNYIKEKCPSALRHVPSFAEEVSGEQ